MARPVFPRSLSEFQAWFDNEEACQRYLVESRWPHGYACPRCGHDEAYDLTSRRLLKCKKCKYQASVTAGTVLHGTRLSLRDWFGAAYLVGTHTPRYRPLRNKGYDHRRETQGHGTNAAKFFPRVHRVFSNLKTWLAGTHHGVGPQHLQHYLNEYMFRFNRRRTPMAAFQSLLGLASQHEPTTYNMLYDGERTG